VGTTTLLLRSIARVLAESPANMVCQDNSPCQHIWDPIFSLRASFLSGEDDGNTNSVQLQGRHTELPNPGQAHGCQRPMIFARFSVQSLARPSLQSLEDTGRKRIGARFSPRNRQMMIKEQLIVQAEIKTKEARDPPSRNERAVFCITSFIKPSFSSKK